MNSINGGASSLVAEMDYLTGGELLNLTDDVEVLGEKFLASTEIVYDFRKQRSLYVPLVKKVFPDYKEGDDLTEPEVLICYLIMKLDSALKEEYPDKAWEEYSAEKRRVLCEPKIETLADYYTREPRMAGLFFDGQNQDILKDVRECIFASKVDESNKNNKPLDLKDDIYQYCNLSSGCFLEADLYRSHILDCNLGDDAYLNSANLESAIIVNSKNPSKITSLSSANLSYTNIEGFDFNGTKMFDITECFSAKFDGCNFKGVITNAISAENLLRHAFLRKEQKKDLVNSLDIKETTMLLTTLDENRRKDVENLLSKEQIKGVSERFAKLTKEISLESAKSV